MTDFKKIKEELIKGVDEELGEVKPDHPRKEIIQGNIFRGYASAINDLASILRESSEPSYQKLGRNLTDFGQIYRDSKK